MAEENDKPLDLGKLPLSKIPMSKGRVPEEWAGKLFTKDYVEKEMIVPPKVDKVKVVPLTYYDSGEQGVGERHVIGTATINPDGTFTAEMDDGTTIEGDSGLLGPVDGNMSFSFGRPIGMSVGDEIALTAGPGDLDVDKVMKIFDENGIGPRDL